MAKHLQKGDEAHRRWKIIDASRSADASLLPQLLAPLDGDESYDNKRHIVRALGNIGSPQVEEKLVGLLGSQQGLILGDVAQALGKLRARRSGPALEGVSDHESEWVRQNVNFALRRIANRR
jgi:HEAT repeat protein